MGFCGRIVDFVHTVGLSGFEGKLWNFSGALGAEVVFGHGPGVDANVVASFYEVSGVF